MKKISPIIIELKKYPIDKWPLFWCELNHGKLPKELINIDKGFFTISDIMKYISNTIGKKECLREWNKNRLSVSEFEEFFDTTGFNL